MKNKKCLIIVNAFQSILKKSHRKPNKIWVEKGSEFYNRSKKSWLEKNDIVMYSTHNEGKSVVTERFIRTLKNKIYKYMTSISKNVYIDKLDDIVDEYNNTYHRTIKMKPNDVNDNTYINIDKEFNDNYPKFKVGLEKSLSLKKLKIQFRGHILLLIVMVNKLLEHSTKKELQEIDQEEFKIEKVIKRKGDKLYVKWKGCHN